MNGQTFFVVFKFFSQNNLLESGNVIYLATILTLDFTLCGKTVMRKVVFRMLDQFMFLFWIIGYGVFTKGNVKSGSPLIEYKGELIHCNEGLQRDVQYQEQGDGCFMFQFCHGCQEFWYVELVGCKSTLQPIEFWYWWWLDFNLGFRRCIYCSNCCFIFGILKS